MKKILITFILAVLLAPAGYSQFTKIGAATGYNYNWHYNNTQDSDHQLTTYPFISFNAIYEINLPFHLVPRLNIYIPHASDQTPPSTGFSYKQIVSGLSLDIDAHYVFNSLDKMELYGLAGLNLLYAKNRFVEKTDGSITFESNDRSFPMGLNLGVGGYWKVKDEFDLFFELKAIVASQIQIVGSFGILMNMDYLWKKEDDSGY